MSYWDMNYQEDFKSFLNKYLRKTEKNFNLNKFAVNLTNMNSFGVVFRS